MKLNKALSRYYEEQVDSVRIAGQLPEMKPKDRSSHSWILDVAFHAALIGVMVTAMVSGYYRPSLLRMEIGEIVNRYNIEDRMIDSLDGLIIIIKNNRSAGGKL